MDPERNLDRHDREQALEHHLDRLVPSRREQWPKDDRRSISRMDAHEHLTPAELQERWPLG